MKEAIDQTKSYLKPDTLVISVAAGLTTTTLCEWLNHTNLIRTMPNTPSMIGQGVTGLYACSGVSQESIGLATQLLEAVGQVVRVNDENLLNAVTALSGSGPAYVFLFIESLIAGAMKLGLTEEAAKASAIQTILGSALLAKQSPDSPEVLRKNVTSKGGTTAAALAQFEQKGFAQMVEEAMLAASRRAEELSQELSQHG